MATQSNQFPGRGYGSVYVDSLIWGCGWTSTPIRYFFGEGAVPAIESSIGGFTGAAWTAAEKEAFESALAKYSAVCNLTFMPAVSPTEGDADIVWWLADETSMGGSGSLGLHEVPDNSWQPIYGYFNYQDSTWLNLAEGSCAYATVMHELGHGLGLAHPHDGGDHADATVFPGVRGAWSIGTYGLNQGIWTTLSYNDGWNFQPSPSTDFGYQATPMALDVAALQKLYGANTGTATGDDVYRLPDQLEQGTCWACIWDAGGIDTISNAGSSLVATINLNAAPLVGANAGGYVSWDKGVPGGYTIANGVVIENAIGGMGNDVLIGNSSANQLNGGAGVDQMSGGLGNDIYYVTAGDVVIEGRGAGGVDTVVASTSWIISAADLENLTLSNAAGAASGSGNSSANTLIGNDFSNTLSGGAGNDVLLGGAGSDRLTGGDGNDTFAYLSLTESGVGSGFRDVITDFKSGDRVDLSVIDAKANSGGNDAFTFIGSAAFSAAGQLRFAAGVLAGDANGDGVADFEIQLLGVSAMTKSGLVL